MSSSDSSINDVSHLSKIQQLEMVALKLVEGSMIGQHASPFKGSSVEFVEHRQYTFGDEIRHIDWRAYGKTGRYFIKQFEEETNLNSYLIFDVSGSMGYGQSTVSKFEYSRRLGAAMAYLLSSQRDSVGLLTYDDRIRERLEPTSHSLRFRQLLKILSEQSTGGEASLSAVFQKLIPTLKRRSLLFIFSDFFDSIEGVEHVLRQLRQLQHDAVLVQVLAPEELTFPFDRPTLFQDIEQVEASVMVDPSRLRKVYLEQFDAFQKQLKNAAAINGFDYLKVVTDQPAERVLGEYLNTRKRQGGAR